MRIDVATRESSQRIAPLRWIRVTAQYVIEIASAGEEPDIDRSAGPFHRVHAASAVVEPIAVRSWATCLHAAALVALTAFTNHGTATTGVHGHGVLGLVAHAFQDVDFAAVRPVGASHPEGGPDPTGVGGHVFEIEDYEAVGILVSACHANAVSTAAGSDIGGVGSDGDLAIRGANKAIGLSGILVYVIDVAMGRIVFLGVRSTMIRELFSKGIQYQR